MAYMCIRGHGECIGCGECTEPAKVSTCVHCKEDICEGDEYYDVPDVGHICKYCMEDYKKTAELPDEPDEPPYWMYEDNDR